MSIEELVYRGHTITTKSKPWNDSTASAFVVYESGTARVLEGMLVGTREQAIQLAMSLVDRRIEEVNDRETTT